MNLMLALPRSGDHASALSHAEVALKLAPEFQPLKNQIAQLTAKVHGSVDHKTMSASHPNVRNSNVTELDTNELNSIEQLESKARSLAASGDRKAAFDLVRKASTDFPDDPRVPRVKGLVLLELQDYVAARIVLSDAARRNPSDAASRFSTGAHCSIPVTAPVRSTSTKPPY